MMGLFGAAALAVNVAAASILAPHRAGAGDANARAAWLFSRNDALGNLAVLAAAGLVASTGTPVARPGCGRRDGGPVPALDREILRDARRDLQRAKARATHAEGA